MRVDVQNTGKRAGDEVVQLYVRDVEASVKRPKKELRGFERISLKPGERKTVSFTLPAEKLSFYDVKSKSFVVEPGQFEVMIGSSSEDIRAKAAVPGYDCRLIQELGSILQVQPAQPSAAARRGTPAGSKSRGRSVRWEIATLICAAIAISYFDRQTLPVAINAIQREIPITNTQYAALQTAFLLAYAFMYAGGGKLVDVLGTRKGFFVIMVWWSLACASHGLATGFALLATSRFLLGMGEGGGFPAATKAVAEWFPVRERSTAMGIINAGTAVGAVIAPPAIALIISTLNWRWVFFLSGAVGLLWTIWWMRDYFPPLKHPRLTARRARGDRRSVRGAQAAGAAASRGCGSSRTGRSGGWSPPNS